MARTHAMASKLVTVPHRHCVFTIDENLRLFFLKDRDLLNSELPGKLTLVH